MYKLIDSKGKTVTMKDGSPFLYSDYRMARLGRMILGTRRNRKLVIQEA